MIKNTQLIVGAAALILAACGGDETGSAVVETEAGSVELNVADLSGASAWSIDREASSIQFRATQNNREFTGTFGRWEAAIVLDLENPSAEGQLEAVVDLSSADAGNRERNEALPDEGWFNTALHPTATYRSNNITSLEDGSYIAEGTLTIKGVTQPVTMPFSLSLDDEGRAVADGSVLLDRSQFGIGEGEFASDKWVAFEVEVLLHIEAEPAS